MSKVLTGNEKIKLIGNIAKTEMSINELMGLIEVPEGISKAEVEKLISEGISTINKETLGLDKVSNTEDLNKPVSQPQKKFIEDSLATKLDKPSGVPVEGSTIIFKGGVWVVENPQ